MESRPTTGYLLESMRVLVTGASGFLGWNFCREERRRFELVLAVHSNAAAPEGVERVELDLAIPESIDSAWERARPDACLALAALTRIDECEANPRALAVNAHGARRLAELAAASGVRLVHASTDLVFDGRRAPYREEDPPSPISDYGRTKAAGERAVLEAAPAALVCRIALAYGPAPGGLMRQVDWILDAARRGRQVSLFVDEFRTPIDSITVARALAELLENDMTGILHLGGVERWSRYDFGRLLLEWAGLDPDLARPATLAECASPRPPDVSLDITRATRELVTPIRPVRESLAEIAPTFG